MPKMPNSERAFRIEERHPTDDRVLRLIARCDDLETARAAFKWAREQYPTAKLVLRQREKVVGESGS